MAFAIVLGAICFLLMEHAVAFWCIFLPLAILFIFFAIKSVFGQGLGVSDYLMANLIGI